MLRIIGNVKSENKDEEIIENKRSGMTTRQTEAAFRKEQCRKKEIKASSTEHELIESKKKIRTERKKKSGRK